MSCSADNSHEQASSGQSNREDASFSHTIESIDKALKTKLQTFAATKHLLVAEAKLSLRALLLAAGIILGLVATAIVAWTAINALIGFCVFLLIPSVLISLLVVVIFNVVLGILLFRELANTWQVVGFEKTINAFTKED